MTKQEFIDSILEEIESETKATPDTLLLEVDGWDSLAKMTVQGILEEIHGIELTYPQINDCDTFDDLLKLTGHDFER